MTWADYEEDGFVDAQPLRCEADHPERGVCDMPLRSWGGRLLYEGDENEEAVCIYEDKHSPQWRVG